MSAKPIARLCAAKVVKYFGLSKSGANKNYLFEAIFSLEDALIV